MQSNDYNTASIALQGGTATALIFFNESIVRMIPYLIAAVPLIVLDLIWGMKAARVRGERIRFSKCLRKTFGKVVEYICWVLLAATMSLAFDMKWIEWIVLGIVFVNEFASIVGNYLETKGIELSLVDLYRLIVRKGAEKVGVEIGKEDAESVIKTKENKPRNSKGQYTKKK